MRIVYVVGARPNFVKMAPLIAALRVRVPDGRHVLVHTGQHYDPMLSEVFLAELGMPKPDYALGVGSGTHWDWCARRVSRSMRTERTWGKRRRSRFRIAKP